MVCEILPAVDGEYLCYDGYRRTRIIAKAAFDQSIRSDVSLDGEHSISTAQLSLRDTTKLEQLLADGNSSVSIHGQYFDRRTADSCSSRDAVAIRE